MTDRVLALALVLLTCSAACDSSESSNESQAGSGGSDGNAGSVAPVCMDVLSLTGVPEALSYYFRCLRDALADAPLGYCLAIQPSYDASTMSLAFQFMRGQGFFRVTAILEATGEEDAGNAAYPIRLELGGDTPLLDNRSAFDSAHSRCATDASLVAAGDEPLNP